MAKVFISHRGSDTAAASDIAVDLRRAGHEVWLDVDEVRPGDSIIAAMDAGLAEATHVVVCYSDDPTAGRWMDVEWHSSLARQLDGHAIRLLPVRIGRSKGPSILADIKYADLTRDRAAGIATLLAALS